MNKYDPEKHEYYIDGIRVPSVTELLPKQNFYCTPEQLEAAREEGTENHNLIKMFFDTRETYENKMLEGLKIYLIGVSDLILYEKRLFSEKHKFAGCPDAVFKDSIIDFKRTPGNKNINALQLAGYNILLKENKIINKCHSWLILNYDGKWKSRNVYNERAEDIFLSLVKKYYIEQSLKNYMEG